MEFLDVPALPSIGKPAAPPASDPARPRADSAGKEFSEYVTGAQPEPDAAAPTDVTPDQPAAPATEAAVRTDATPVPAATDTLVVATVEPVTRPTAIALLPIAPMLVNPILPQIDAVIEGTPAPAAPHAPAPAATPELGTAKPNATVLVPAIDTAVAALSEEALAATPTAEAGIANPAAPTVPTNGTKPAPQAQVAAPQIAGAREADDAEVVADAAVAALPLAPAPITPQNSQPALGTGAELASAPDAADAAPMPSRGAAPTQAPAPPVAGAQAGAQPQTNGNAGNQSGNQLGTQPGAVAANGGAEASSAARPAAADFAATLAADGAADVAQKSEAPAAHTSTLGALAANEASTTNPIQAAKAPAAAARAHFVQPPPTPAAQVAVSIAQAAADGARQIGVHLHPEELGRVEVKLDISHDGRVSAVVLADRPDTLALLKDDASALERALEEAGLDPNQGGLKFGLREQADGNERRPVFAQRDNGGDVAPEAAAASLRAGRWTGGMRALDISV